jgi:hypothetical protein
VLERSKNQFKTILVLGEESLISSRALSRCQPPVRRPPLTKCRSSARGDLSARQRKAEIKEGRSKATAGGRAELVLDEHTGEESRPLSIMLLVHHCSTQFLVGRKLRSVLMELFLTAVYCCFFQFSTPFLRSTEGKLSHRKASIKKIKKH